MGTDDQNPMTFNDLAATVEVVYKDDHEFLDAALEKSLRDMVATVARLRRKGKITINLTFEHENERDMKISASISAKPPVPSASPARVYVDSRHRLVADDPKQGKLFEENGGRRGGNVKAIG